MSMHIYGICANYNKMKENNQNKGFSIYIDGRPKAYKNVVGFISSTHPRSTNKLPNYIFVEGEDNKVVVNEIKSISTGKELLLNYHLNGI